MTAYTGSPTPTGPAPLTSPAFTALMTDAVFGLPTVQLSRQLAGGGAPTFRYLLTHTGSTSFADLLGALPAWQLPLLLLSRALPSALHFPSAGLGAAHADDLLYLFPLTPVLNLIPAPQDQQLSENMVKLWTNFARDGDPNG